jgi:hypothetical protein
VRLVPHHAEDDDRVSHFLYVLDVPAEQVPATRKRALAALRRAGEAAYASVCVGVLTPDVSQQFFPMAAGSSISTEAILRDWLSADALGAVTFAPTSGRGSTQYHVTNAYFTAVNVSKTFMKVGSHSIDVGRLSGTLHEPGYDMDVLWRGEPIDAVAFAGPTPRVDTPGGDVFDALVGRSAAA